jgi:hypothetical protein
MRRVKAIPAGANGLPAKFTAEERAAFQWLEDVGIRGWMVDYKDKSVKYCPRKGPERQFVSLIAMRAAFDKAKEHNQ